ncbi:MAG TPA: bifunctional phosphopantothenoylcysteine decarboxylase/phosphopantothenate--cysteine ligase CoaBC [Pyrinomonadaceae bacterium]|nr:bifunctional phosphopantothenoylcysteine decarboxylase/phosphopantothenate--cysteine ligase CoaBC [Pyrinomonadaceae bacterium]
MNGQVLIHKKVALAVTGGISAYKAIEILRGLQRSGCDVRVAMTRHACEFVQPLTFRALSGSYVIVDDYSPQNPDPIAHITFSQTIDLFVIAPATANTLAKLANGVADDFVTSTYLACTAPVLVAPAMNTKMWEHSATRRNIEKLKGDGVQIIEPDAGEMACGTIGPGRLSTPERIVSAALKILEHDPADSSVRDLVNEKILITAGATREPIDPVRFISNRSSGKMGFALAAAARARGAQVRVVSGVTTASAPPDVDVIKTTTAEEMRKVVMRELGDTTIFIAAAAVADYRPKRPAAEKIKKAASVLTLELERTADILNEVARKKIDSQLVIGFAAETGDVIPNAQTKMKGKDLDMIVANDVSREGAGFDSEDNEVTILVRENPEAIAVPLSSKDEVANKILDEIMKLRGRVPRARSAPR